MADTYQPFYTASHALLIGINSYSDPRLAPLGRAEDDTQAMADLLCTAPYDFNIRLLLGEQATKRAILEALYGLRATGPDDRLLVYFAGHGYTIVDRLGGESGYLAAVDTVPEQDFTALEMADVTSLRRYAAAKHIAFIFDACFSGQALGLTRTTSVASDKLMQRRAYQVLSAGAGDQTVADYYSMTGLLINALYDEPVSGAISLNTIGLSVQQQMAASSRQLQIPQFGHLSGSQGGDLIFRQAAEALPFSPDLVSALRAESGYVRWGAVVELVGHARSDDPELAEAARNWLQRMAEEDPYHRVREAAEAFFAEEEARARAQAAWNIQVTDTGLKAAQIEAAQEGAAPEPVPPAAPAVPKERTRGRVGGSARPWWQRPWAIAGLAALVLLIAGGVAAGLWFTRGHPGGTALLINESSRDLCSLYNSPDSSDWSDDLFFDAEVLGAGQRQRYTMEKGTRWVTVYACGQGMSEVLRLQVPGDGSTPWVEVRNSDF